MVDIPRGFEEIGPSVPDGFEELPSARRAPLARTPDEMQPLAMGLPGAEGWHQRGWGERALGRGFENLASATEGMAAAARGQDINDVDKWAQLTESMKRPGIPPEEYRRFSTARSLLERNLRTAVPGDYDLADPSARARIKAQLAGRLIENATSVEARRKTIETDYPREPESEAAIGRKGESFGTAASNFWQQYSQNPLKITAELGLESLLPSVAAIGAGVATRSPFTAATVMGLASGGQEYGSSLFEVMRDAKIDTTKPQAVLDALRDPEKSAEVRRLAAAKAIPVAVLDALSIRLATVMMAPRAFGRVGQHIANVPAQTAAQGLLGGLGEASGQMLQKGKVEDWGQVFAEIVGEAAGAPIEVAGMRGTFRNRDVAAPMRPPTMPEPSPAPAVPPPPMPAPAPASMAPMIAPRHEALLPNAEIITPPGQPSSPFHPETGVPLRTPTGSAIPQPPEGRPEGIEGRGQRITMSGGRTAKLYPIQPGDFAPTPSRIERASHGLDRLAPDRSAVFTPAGRRIDVSYEVVDLDALQTSHTDDLRPNSSYPAELQPRDRERAASEAQIVDISSRLEPSRLGRSADTSSGAPIVGADNVVESGNGRVLGLRRAYARNPERAEAYKAFLQSQGFDISGMSRPVLVARRQSQLTPQQRVDFTREANAASTLRMSASETAKADAEIVRPILGQFKGGDVSFPQNASMARAFVNALPASERGALLGAGGELTQEGVRRIQGALMQAAYGDAALVAKVFESPNTDIKAIGGALLDVAPAWAKMAESAKRGEISKEVDRTNDLMAAVRAIEEARRKGMLASDVFNQGGLFSNLDTARDFGRMLFNDDAMKKSASRQAMAARLRAYVDEANKTSAGADMFGTAPASAKDILKATKGKEVPEGFEEIGTTLRSGFDPTQPYQWYQRQAQKVLDFIHQKGGYKFAPLRNLPDQPEYLARRYETLGKLAEIDKIADHIFRAFRFVTKADKGAIHDYMNTRGAAPDAIANVKARAEAVEAKRLILEVGRRLVSRGMLPQEVFDLHAGEYLPRVYLKHLLGPRFGSSRAKLDLGYLKQRKDIPADVRRLILGEIVDPAYLASRGFDVPMRDMALADFLEQLSGHDEWVLRDSFVTWEGQQLSAAWLWHEAQRLRKMAESVEAENRDDVIRKAIDMEAVARPGLAVEKVEGFKQIPDSPRYGRLRGVWVRKEIWDDLFGNMGFMIDDPSFAERLLGQQGYISRATQFWKLLKVPFNPPTIARNAVGNVMLLQMSGVPLIRLPDRLAKAIAEMVSGGRHWQIAKKYGVTNTNFAHTEMLRLDRWARYTMSRSDQPITKLTALVAGFADKAANFYGKLEAVAKTAKIIDAMEREGKSEKDAALEAHKWIFDYSLIPQTIRYLRNAPVGMPFVTFNYKAAPRLVELAAKHPWRLWPYVTAAMLLPALAMEGLDLDEEEYKALRASIPKHMRERGHVFILPWRDEHGRFQYVDVSAFMPWNWFQDVGSEAAKGNIGGAVYKTGFGGPFAQVLSALTTNTDPFTGRPITNKADPYSKQVGDALHYAWRMAAPNWIADRGAADYMLKAMAGEVDKRTGKPGMTETQAAGRFVGVNTYPLDPQQSRASEVARMNAELRDIQRRMGQVLFDKNLTPAQRENARQTYVEHYREKAGELQKYLKDTARAPKPLSPFPENRR